MNLKNAFLAAAAIVLLPASAFAQSNFPVTVYFSPGGPTTTVSLSCNGGVPLDQSKAGLGTGEGVTFVVAGTDANTDCTASGAAVAGYSIDASDCSWTDVGPDYTPEGPCVLAYVASDVSFTVYKDWVLDGPGAADVDPYYSVTVGCDAEITCTGSTWEYNGNYYCEYDFSGTADRTISVSVDAEGGAPSCWADESIRDSAVSASDNCGSRSIPVGGSSSCTMTNTVFYEGIPTLSQYGLAVLALLMLGVGFVGFRRFV